MNTQRFPAGFFHIVSNEAAERFSYYGMKAILVIYMTHHLRSGSGVLAPMSETEARGWYHLFSSANYLFPLLGSVLADVVWGKYKTIIRLSLVYCLGHLVMALFEDKTGLFWGLTLIAIGSGGIKPCVSAHLGDQFSLKTRDFFSAAFSWFYLSINIGAFVSTLLTPVLLESYGPHVAFGLPGVLMFIATFIFWLGRTRYRAIPPVAPEQYWQALWSEDGKKALKSLGILYVFIAFFWALFDQTGSTWVLQLENMNRTVSVGSHSFELLPSQLQALNPILILLFVPLCTQLIYPLVGKFVQISSLGKISSGMALSGVSFFILAYVEQLIAAGSVPTILWQVGAYAILTFAEILVSITALEFAYTQAPAGLKSLYSSLYLLSVSLGNFITAGLGYVTDVFLELDRVSYFIFFGALPILAAIFLGIWSSKYPEKLHLYDN